MDERATVVTKCREMLSRGAPLEAVLAYMREYGLSKGQSIRVVVETVGKSLSEAKNLVHSSETWSDVRMRDEKFHDELLKYLTLPPDSDTSM